MGKTKSAASRQPQQQGADQQLLLKSLNDFTSKENWDTFFAIRGSGDSFEWYAEWPHLRPALLPLLSCESQILVPGCGNSRLSEHLYDDGFRCITNVDFSKVVISDMLRRNVRDRPDMRWRVMDMTDMQFSDEAFDVILDKGGLDALMEPEHGRKLGNKYLSEVKRILKPSGRFICLTLAEAHVLGLLFSNLRFGWKMDVHVILIKSANNHGFCTFMVVAVKENSNFLQEITTSFNLSSLNCDEKQLSGLQEELELENKIRDEYSSSPNLLHTLKDLKLSATDGLDELIPGRRVQLILYDQDSRFSYKAVLFDSREQSTSFIRHCGIMLVPKTRVHGWLYSSEEGQWTVVESAKSARLIMVFLDGSHIKASMEEIQKDLSPLVRQLAPAISNHGSQIPFMMVDDPLKERKIVHQVSSPLTGLITIEDVVYDNFESDISEILPSGSLTFRRLIFQRNESLVQSEALMTSDGSIPALPVASQRDEKSYSKAKSRKKGMTDILRINHEFLASPYHSGIISGFMLISSYLESMLSSGTAVRAVVVGLGAGLLPMFIHQCMQFIHVEAVELDPNVVRLAKEYFDFRSGDRLKVHVTDGIEFVKRIANKVSAVEATEPSVEGNTYPKVSASSEASRHKSLIDNNCTAEVSILIVDVDNNDPSSGLSCPAADFVEEAFLNDVHSSISSGGLFVVNLVSRLKTIKEKVVSRMKAVFKHIYSLKLDEDVNEILFALRTEDCVAEDHFNDAASRLEKLLVCKHPIMSQAIADASKKIRYVA
ncbi:hypothetical protein MLD38_011009 [Melastoma candidum]|uniref:Uncharacterized protein n=1 Tax=Melastoma candidum TaxID=119954 RepID=A0ACB9R1Q5_9MYRT|nr:hypothetical protein MLD38_011009 [Melastoma candidum]